MSAPRFFAGQPLAEGAVRLDPEERRHVRSRRLAPRDPVVLIDGSGLEAEATLAEDGVSAVVTAVRPCPAEARTSVTVLLAASEPSRVEWAVEKGTECGAGEFVLVAAERSQAAHVRALGEKRERLARIAREAVKQCGRARVPRISGPVSLEDALNGAPPSLAVASPGSRRAPESLPATPQLAIAIGPEGGFSPAEEARLRAAGASFVGLGPRTLRLETAVVAFLSRLRLV